MNEERIKNKEGNHQFTPTKDQLRFFMDNGAEYTIDTLSKGRTPDPEEHFKFLCDSLHKHEDAEVRVGFAQSLMFLGFKEFMDIVGKSMDQMNRLLPKGLIDKLNKMSAEEIARMSPEEAHNLTKDL